MKVVVDTSVWSLALRRNQIDNTLSVINQLCRLITDGKVVLLGVVRQEVLSGIRNHEQFIRLRDYLRAFPDLDLFFEDYELAAEYYNTCRQHGIQGSNTDFLLCAASVRRNYSILTTDRDFENFLQYIPIMLL